MTNVAQTIAHGKMAASPTSMLPPSFHLLVVRQDRAPLVVVADDGQVTGPIIEAALGQIGFRACTAHDGRGALREIREHHPDLILLDVSPLTPMALTSAAVCKTTPGCEVEKGTQQIIFDFSEARMIDSSGIGLLIAASNRMSQKNGELLVVNTSPEILRLMQSMRLVTRLNISGRAAAEPPHE